MTANFLLLLQVFGNGNVNKIPYKHIIFLNRTELVVFILQD